MAYVQWDESLSVGVAVFDEDHRKLVALINHLHDGIVTGGGQTAMVTALDELVRYTVFHFSREEELMAKNAYPAFAAHKAEHDALVAKVKEYQEQLSSGRRAFSLELMSFLKDWLVKHIMGTDMQYRAFFNGKGIA